MVPGTRDQGLIVILPWGIVNVKYNKCKYIRVNVFQNHKHKKKREKNVIAIRVCLDELFKSFVNQIS